MTDVNKEEVKKLYREAYIKLLGKKPEEYENFVEMFNEDVTYWNEAEKLEAEYPELKADFAKIQSEENIAYEVRNSTLKGSEKQIAWAAEIQYNIRHVFDAAMNHIRQLNDVRTYEAEELIRERWGRIYDAKYAADIIGLFGHIHFTGDAAKDFDKICSVYKMSVPQTEGQAEILGKPSK